MDWRTPTNWVETQYCRAEYLQILVVYNEWLLSKTPKGLGMSLEKQGELASRGLEFIFHWGGSTHLKDLPAPNRI